MTIGDRLDMLMRQRKMSSPALAGRLEISDETVRRWRAGKTEPTASHIAAIAKIFGTTTDWLVTGREPQTGGLDDDSATILRLWRALGISADEAIRRLADIRQEPERRRVPDADSAPAS